MDEQPSTPDPLVEQPDSGQNHEPPPTASTGEEPLDPVDEWGEESFPASDPPEGWAGKDIPPS